MSTSLAKHPKRPPATAAATTSVDADPYTTVDARRQGNPRRIDWSRLSPEKRHRVNQLILKNRGLVYKAAFAASMKYPLMDDDVIFAAVNYTLARCALRFKPELGWKFSTFTYRSLLRSAFQVCQAETRKDRVRGQGRKTKQLSDIDKATIPRAGPTPVRELIDREETELGERFIRHAIFELEPRDRHLIIGRVLYEKTLTKVGEEMLLTRERIRQIEMSLYKVLFHRWRSFKDRFALGLLPPATITAADFEELINMHAGSFCSAARR
jgi:RNA polymerase sigma factor (sigma-70 family)